MRYPVAALTVMLVTATAVTLVAEFAKAQGQSQQQVPLPQGGF